MTAILCQSIRDNLRLLSDTFLWVLLCIVSVFICQYRIEHNGDLCLVQKIQSRATFLGICRVSVTLPCCTTAPSSSTGDSTDRPRVIFSPTRPAIAHTWRSEGKGLQASDNLRGLCSSVPDPVDPSGICLLDPDPLLFWITDPRIRIRNRYPNRILTARYSCIHDFL